MPHTFTFQAETAAGVTFICSACAQPVEFVKPVAGNPNPIWDGAQWQPPMDPDQWTGPCPVNDAGA